VLFDLAEPSPDRKPASRMIGASKLNATLGRVTELHSGELPAAAAVAGGRNSSSCHVGIGFLETYGTGDAVRSIGSEAVLTRPVPGALKRSSPEPGRWGGAVGSSATPSDT
jgi:hypothetical protein